MFPYGYYQHRLRAPGSSKLLLVELWLSWYEDRILITCYGALLGVKYQLLCLDSHFQRIPVVTPFRSTTDPRDQFEVTARVNLTFPTKPPASRDRAIVPNYNFTHEWLYKTIKLTKCTCWSQHARRLCAFNSTRKLTEELKKEAR